MPEDIFDKRVWTVYSRLLISDKPKIQPFDPSEGRLKVMNKHYHAGLDRWVYDDPEIEAWAEEVREYAAAEKAGQPVPTVERTPRGVHIDPRAAQLRQQYYESRDTSFRVLPGGAALPENSNTNTVTANSSDLTEGSLREAMELIRQPLRLQPHTTLSPPSQPTATQVRLQQAQAQAQLERAYQDQQRQAVEAQRVSMPPDGNWIRWYNNNFSLTPIREEDRIISAIDYGV